MKVPRLLSSSALLAALFVVVAHTTAAAQQVPDSARVAEPASSASVSSPSTLPGPRLSPQFSRVEPTLARSTTSETSSLAVADGQHTIVISTLVLVLGVIILVLLIK